MPLTPIDYSKCKIYRIVCKDLSVPCTYVGHTTDLVRRRANHKKDCTRESSKKYHYNVYKQIRENGGWDNFSMVLVEDYPCNGHEEASARERYWIEQFLADLNTRVPNRKYAEWREDNREHILQKARVYQQKNKEKITEKRNVRTLCCCGSDYTDRNKSQHLKTKKHLNFISSQSIQTTDAEATTDSETN